jgi:ABC-type transport system substrate-binding protein
MVDGTRLAAGGNAPMPASRTLLVIPITLGMFVTLLAAGLVVEARQADGKKRVEEEDDKPRKKQRAEEEDDRGAGSGVSRLDEDAEKLPASKGVPTTDLLTAERNATHPRVKALFKDLSVPHDRVSVRGFGGTPPKTLWVEPLAEHIPDIQMHKGSVTLHVLELGDDGKSRKRDRTETFPPSHISSIRWYEQVAADEVKEFLAIKNFATYDTSNPLYLGPYDQLVVAEQALSAVLLYHRSARERGARKGDGWEAVGHELGAALLGVQLSRVDRLGDQKTWDQAFALTRRLVDTYTRPEDRKRIARPLGDLLSKALKDRNFAESRLKDARAQMRFIEEQFPGGDVARPIQEKLKEEAEDLFRRAKELVAADKKRDAVELLRRAEDVWPDLPELHAYRMRTDEEYQVLSVGMRELPRWMSPSWACTDAELRAVELLFESLVSMVPQGDGVSSYRPSLAEGRSKVIQDGRQFQLPRQAKWSSGRDLRVDDLRATVQLLQKGEKPAGRSAAWGELLANVGSGADSSQVKLLLRQGLLDPLGAMSFKVLPRFPDQTTKPFAENPVSSGPFIYKEHASENGRRFARFEANPHYGVRDDKRGLPRIREVRFYAVTDPVAELQASPPTINLALDLTPEQAFALSKNPAFEVPMPSARTPNRRVYFLAVNNRNHALAQADVRIALARAIPREQLLDAHFRKGLGRQVHKALNGPYPAAVWACDPKLVSRKDKTSLDPFDPQFARARLSKHKANSLTLTLKYPAGDKVLDEAMKALCDAVKKELPQVTLKPEPRPAHALREEVEVTHNYELAYYHHDFVDETLWLSPLLGPHGRGGAENYLGYTGSLVGNVQAAMTLREFPEVQKYARAIHEQFLESDMPMVPLWQLDPLCAYEKRVVDFDRVADPLPWFHEVERWRVRPR